MARSSPLQVGITGGIGAGKSIASKIFAILGVPIYDADSQAKSLMNADSQLKSQISSLLGAEAYQNDSIDRAWVAKKVFSNRSLLDQLNALVHPAVGRDYQQWVEANLSKSVLIKEAALLFETGLAEQMDQVIVVSAPEEMRISRVLSRDKHRSQSDVEAILKNQMSEEEKVAKANFVILNDEKQSVIQQVLSIHAELLSQVSG